MSGYRIRLIGILSSFSVSVLSMKRTELFFSIFLVPLDFTALLLAAFVAQKIRFLDVVEGFRPAVYTTTTENLAFYACVVAAVWIFLFALAGLYSRRITDSFYNQFLRIVAACSAGLVFVIFVVFLHRDFFSSRFIILAAWFLAICFVTVLRIAIRKVQHLLFRYGIAARRVAIIGTSGTAEELVAQIKLHVDSGYRVVVALPPTEVSLLTLRELVNKRAIDELIYADARASSEERALFLEFSESNHLTFRYTPDLLHSAVRRPVVNVEIGIPLVEVPVTKIEGWGRIFKRAIDVVAGVCGLLFFSPLFVFVAVGIFFETGRPIIYVSERVGRGGLFTFYKFRSMYLKDSTGEQYGGAAAQQLHDELVATSGSRGGPVPKVANDPRVTPFGVWLRRLSLDELPQFWNILKGDMSLIGPRPHLPWEVSRYEKHHRKVLAIKPGLTGLSQVSGRSDLDFEEEVRLDRYYIEEWSPFLDMLIVLRTISAIFRSRRAL